MKTRLVICGSVIVYLYKDYSCFKGKNVLTKKEIKKDHIEINISCDPFYPNEVETLIIKSKRSETDRIESIELYDSSKCIIQDSKNVLSYLKLDIKTYNNSYCEIIDGICKEYFIYSYQKSQVSLLGGFNVRGKINILLCNESKGLIENHSLLSKAELKHHSILLFVKKELTIRHIDLYAIILKNSSKIRICDSIKQKETPLQYYDSVSIQIEKEAIEEEQRKREEEEQRIIEETRRKEEEKKNRELIIKKEEERKRLLEEEQRKAVPIKIDSFLKRKNPDVTFHPNVLDQKVEIQENNPIENELCNACDENPAYVMFVPCNHCVYCVHCIKSFFLSMNKDKWICPFCRHEIMDIQMNIKRGKKV